MKNITKILIISAVLLMMVIPSIAQETNHINQNQTNNQTQKQTDNQRQKTIYLDTGGKTGHLTYIERYYIVNNEGNLTVDQNVTYFNGEINNSKMRIMIIRPLDKQGKLYPDSQVQAIATLDNEVILNAWYEKRVLNTESNVNNGQTAQLQHPELFISLIVVIFIIVIAVVMLIRKRKKGYQ